MPETTSRDRRWPPLTRVADAVVDHVVAGQTDRVRTALHQLGPAQLVGLVLILAERVHPYRMARARYAAATPKSPAPADDGRWLCEALGIDPAQLRQNTAA
ncbi:hypothetical protein [Actinoplanes sp. URMC 104]|uniref:hypothetical protein n=1 Tax=Actinoplanes sp. URMC 104 TaxID=3423409 RepID=UPI003F1CD856